MPTYWMGRVGGGGGGSSLSVAVADATDRSPLPGSSESLRPALDHSREVKFCLHIGWGCGEQGRRGGGGEARGCLLSLSVAVADVTDRSPLSRSSESVRPVPDHFREMRSWKIYLLLDFCFGSGFCCCCCCLLGWFGLAVIFGVGCCSAGPFLLLLRL